MRRHFAHKGRQSWIFYGTCSGREYLVFLLPHVRIVRHFKTRQDANPFDPQWWQYFEGDAESYLWSNLTTSSV